MQIECGWIEHGCRLNVIGLNIDAPNVGGLNIGALNVGGFNIVQIECGCKIEHGWIFKNGCRIDCGLNMGAD